MSPFFDKLCVVRVRRSRNPTLRNVGLRDKAANLTYGRRAMKEPE